jgi:predicted transcriptional regulator
VYRVDIVSLILNSLITTSKEVSVNKYHHLLKLWILNLKYYLRESDEAENSIRKLASRTINRDIQNKEIFQLMSEILKEIKFNTEPKIHNFIEKCEEELNQKRKLFKYGCNC